MLLIILFLLSNIVSIASISCACASGGNSCVVAIDKCGGKYPYAQCVQPNPPFRYGCGDCSCWSNYLGPSAINKSDIDCTCHKDEGDFCLYDCECCAGMTCAWSHGFVCGYYEKQNAISIPLNIPGSKFIKANHTLNNKISSNTESKEIDVKIFTWSDPWNIGNAATLSKQSLHLYSNGIIVYNYWLDTNWRTDCLPRDGCQHIYLFVSLYNEYGAVIDNRGMDFLESCAHGARDNSGKFDPSEYSLVATVQMFASSSRGFVC